VEKNVTGPEPWAWPRAAHADIAGYTGLIRVHADFKFHWQAEAEEDHKRLSVTMIPAL
jgi:hypothetical protein